MEMETFQDDLPAESPESVEEADENEVSSDEGEHETDESNDAEQETSEEDTSEDEDSKSEKKKNHRDRRIEKAFAENSYLKARMQLLEQQMAQRTQQNGSAEIVDDSLEPDPSKFEQTENGYRQYMVEHQRWLARQTQRELAAIRSEFSTKQSTVSSAESEEFVKNTPDYAEVVKETADIPFPKDLIPIIQQDKDAAKIHYYLAKNPELAYAFNTMPPAQALMEIGRIKAEVAKQPNKTVTKKLTTAAPPAFKPPVAGIKEKKDPAKMSAKEWANYWNKKEGKVRNKTFI